MNGYILNHNRLGTLPKLAEFMVRLGLQVTILDSGSTYPALLEWYRTECRQPVRYLENKGHTGHADLFRDEDRFVFTDPDLDPADTPLDLLERLGSLLDNYPELGKAGPGLMIDDLPDCYPLKARVQAHERRLLGPWIDGIARCSYIDTTFAMYRNGRMFGDWRTPAARLVEPYLFRHVDWYVDPANLGEEYAWYLKHAGPAASYASQLKALMTGARAGGAPSF